MESISYRVDRARQQQIDEATAMIMRAYCGNTEAEEVPEEYKHCKTTAASFMVDYLVEQGFFGEVVSAAAVNAKTNYFRAA